MTVKLPHPKRQRDLNQLAKQVVDVATGLTQEEYPLVRSVDPQAKRRGEARAEKLTPEQRSEIGKKGAATRWAKANQKKRGR